MVFIDLEKAYDRVPRQEFWRCMREKGVPEKYVMIVQDMYEGARTRLKSSVGLTDMIPVGVGLHQGSSLSPYLFAMIMDVLARGIKDISPWCMLYADDIVLCGTRSEVVEKKLEEWRRAMEDRGLKINRKKTVYLRFNNHWRRTILELVENITTSIDDCKSTVGIFIDLKKAFDTVDHDILMTRSQYVCINDTSSECMNITCGVPQGSILGPALFILYINDMCNVSMLMKSIVFADDTNFFYSGDNLSQVCETVSTELGKLHSWFQVNKLSLNIAKTNFMIFGKKNSVKTITWSV